MSRFFRFIVSLSGAAMLVASVAAWQFETPSRRFHDKTTFRLEGRHLDVACESCHLKGVYKGTPTTCFACHWERRQDDRFRLQLGSQCEQCHRPTSWTATRFDHGAATGMPLGVAHAQLPCQSCHKNDTLRAAENSCVSCHRQEYQSTREPNHVAAGFSTSCESCHRMGDASFRQARFDHQSVFPLVGAHAQQACAGCHRDNVFRGTARDCVGCHRDAYNRTTAPNHAAAGFSLACESCHRPTDSSFRGAGFNHATVFPLVGQHAQQLCAACHKGGVFRGTPRDCAGCHREAYNRTTAPNHAAAGFSLACETCHRPTDSAFGGAGFNHATVFPLVGQHAQQACAACHRNNVYRGTSRECVGCHRDTYNRTTAPNHASAGFSTSCESCHRASDASFGGGSFNHGPVFPLVGPHAQQSCGACHANAVFSGTARTCVGCHRSAYERTSSPAHAAAGFSTSCDGCHRATDSSWRQGRFTHRFPITSGRHNVSCSNCHQSTSYQNFTCLTCHEHSQSRMDDKHRERSGYRYDSRACYSCHPTGREN